MRFPEQLLELVDLRPHDVDPAVADPFVRSKRERAAPEHEHILRRLQARGVEQRLFQAGATHRWMSLGRPK